MQLRKPVAGVMLLGLVLAACGGATPGGPTQGTGGDPTQAPGGGGPTQAPGGGGGNTGGGTGSMHVEVSGPVTGGGDYPFFANGSRFAGDVAGVNLTFTSDGSDAIASVGSFDNDIWTITLLSEELAVNATDCVLTNWNIGATSATGTFDCKGGFATETATGAYHEGVFMKGSFTAAK